MSVNSRRCIVTGASAGIGHAIHVRLERAGYEVVGMQRNPPGIPVDLRDTSAIAHAWQRAIETLGGAPDLLVLNAGVSVDAPFTDTSVQLLIDVLQLNVVAALAVAREAVVTWRHEGKVGHIVFIGSQAALPGAKHTGNVAYTASKGAIHAIVGPLAAECGPEIRVNCVAPGDVPTATEMLALRQRAEKEGVTLELLWTNISAKAALKRWVEADEVADAVIFLDCCRAMTGAIINVSAGASIG